MDAGRNAMSTTSDFPARNQKGQRRSRDFRRGISYELWSQLGPNKVSTLGASWCVLLAPSISKPNRAVCRGSAIVSVHQCIAQMAIHTREESGMLTLPNPPQKEGPFL